MQEQLCDPRAADLDVVTEPVLGTINDAMQFNATLQSSSNP